MKTYEQMASDVFEKGDRLIRKNRNRKRGAALACACVTAVLIAGFYPVIKAEFLPPKTEGGGITTVSQTVAVSQEDGFEVSQGDGSVDSPTTGAPAPDTSDNTLTTTVVPTENYGGDAGGKSQDGSTSQENRPCDSSDSIKITGEEITDGEAARYFEENMAWLQRALSASGVPCDDLEIKETGYCHISLDDGELRRNFRDYLAYSGGKIAAIITVTKENGVLSSTPALGAPWFDSFTRFLDEHRGQELIFTYAGFLEAVICPDGKCVNPMGTDVSGYFGNADGLYENLYMKEAVYIP